MISTSDIKHRIGTIKQTRQITKAMYLLSATKIKRDAGWVELTRAYFRRVRATMRDILEHAGGAEHRYMQPPRGERAAFIVIAADKGLAGGYNHAVLSYALEQVRDRRDPVIIAVGQETRSFFHSRGYEVNTDFVHIGQRPYLFQTRRLIEYIFQKFDDDEIDEIYAIYTRYDSPVKQFPQMVKLLPILLFDYEDMRKPADASVSDVVIYEPSPQEVFDVLVPEFAIGLMFGGMVQSYISEHTARMTAMESATKNADEMIAKLSLQYNMARQYAITQEISEIVSAAELLGQEGRAYEGK